MGQHEFDRTRFIVRKLWDLKLQIHMIEKKGTQLSGVVGYVITLMLRYTCTRGYYYKIIVCLAKRIIRSYSMRQRRIASARKPPNGIVTNCDVCGGLVFHA